MKQWRLGIGEDVTGFNGKLLLKCHKKLRIKRGEQRKGGKNGKMRFGKIMNW